MKTFVKEHWVKISLIGLVFCILLGQYEYKMPKRRFADFHVYYYTGQKMLKGENVYDAKAYREDGIANFKYPPLFALFTSLFALTNELAAATIWFILNYIFLILFMFYSGKLIFSKEQDYKYRNWIYFWSLFMTSRFCLDNFTEGQVNFLMMATLLLGLYFANKKKDLLGGMFIGFSIFIKYMGLIFLPYLIIKKRFKLAFFIILSFILFSMLPILFLGWQRNLSLQNDYLPQVFSTSLDFSSLSDYSNQSIWSIILRYLSTHGNYGINLFSLSDYNLGIISGFIVCLLFFICLIKGRYRSKDDAMLEVIDLGIILTLVALLNPNAWLHAFIFLVFGYMVVFDYLFKNGFKDRLVLSLVVLSFILHSFTSSFFTLSWAGKSFQIYSFVALGALAQFVSLCKIKFYPRGSC